jgi:hypothetical protein
MEMVEVDLERISLASTMMQLSPAAPPMAGCNVHGADSVAYELFGCYSPRARNNSVPSIHVASMEGGDPQWFSIPVF